MQIGGITVQVTRYWPVALGILIWAAVVTAEDPFDGIARVVLTAAVFSGLRLFHELGHAAACRLLDVDVHRIELNLVSGVCVHEDTLPKKRVLISLAGPMVEIGCVLLAMGWYQTGVSYVDHTLAAVMLWGGLSVFFNLLPITHDNLDRDGFSALFNLQRVLGSSVADAERRTVKVGLATAGLLAVAGAPCGLFIPMGAVVFAHLDRLGDAGEGL